MASSTVTGIPRSVFEESERLLSHLRTDEAEELILSWLQRYPKNHDLWHNMAIIKMFREDWDQSEAAFHKCFEVSPDFEDALFNCATMHWRAGAHDKCMQVLRRLVALNPNRADAVLNAGDLCHMLRRYWDAAQYFERYTDIFPHKRREMLPKMVICLQYAEQERPDDIHVKYALLDILAELESLESMNQ